MPRDATDSEPLPDEHLVQDIGEQGLLARLLQFCPPELVGDDAAVLALPNVNASIAATPPAPTSDHLVVTTDVLVDGVHFSLGLANPQVRTTSPADVGWRAATANLSDLAAMGASPVGITVGLSLPGRTPIAWVEELYRGMVDCLSQFSLRSFNPSFDTALGSIPIVGGDICRSPILTVAITALGAVNPQQVWRRSTAQLNDVILVTGRHGAARAGLELLLQPEIGQLLPEAERRSLIRCHQRPQPRLDVVLQVQALWSESTMAIDRITAMDSSDGLADAVLQICRASGVGAELWRDRLPMPSIFADWLPLSQAIEWTLYGGEDFELVLCLPDEQAAILQARLGSEAASVGRITPGDAVVLKDRTATYPDEILTLNQGFQHF